MEFFTEKDIPIIQKYLSNQMEGTELAQFEARLQEDERLQSELEWYNAMFNAIEEQEDERLKHMLKQSGHQQQEEEKKIDWRRILFGIIIALGVLAALFLILQPETEQTEPLDKPYPVIADASIERGERGQNVDSIQNVLKVAQEQFLQNYQHGNYEAALTTLERLPDSDFKLFYAANCLIALDRSAEAIQPLQIVEKEYTNSIFSSFAKWYLALAYYKIGDRLKAKSYAQLTIDSEEMQPEEKDKAKRLLELLDR